MRANTLMAGLAAILIGASGAMGQEAPTPPAPPPAEPPRDELPTLDDLLGLPQAPDAARRTPGTDPASTELERKLSMREAAQQFKQAVVLMSETADRIRGAGDTGIATQRLQEDVVRKLDMLIQAAEQNSQQSQQSSSSSSSGDPDRQSQPNQQRPEQGEQQQNQGDNRAEATPPGRAEGALDPNLAARGAAWGSLPARVRDALMQGTQEQYSSVYQRLTEAYYRKLAESPK